MWRALCICPLFQVAFSIPGSSCRFFHLLISLFTQTTWGRRQPSPRPLVTLAAAMTSTTDFDNVEITQQYSHINTRFDLSDEELDNDNSSARLFERSRIKALAGECLHSKQAASSVTDFRDDSLFKSEREGHRGWAVKGEHLFNFSWVE